MIFLTQLFTTVEPLFSDKPLGLDEIYQFGLKDLGMLKLLSQAKHARNGSIMDDLVRWGLESVVAKNEIELVPDTGDPFPFRQQFPCRAIHDIQQGGPNTHNKQRFVQFLNLIWGQAGIHQSFKSRYLH